MLNKEMLAEEFSYAGPFYHHHLTEELRQTRLSKRQTGKVFFVQPISV
jgi:hypothetical protein